MNSAFWQSALWKCALLSCLLVSSVASAAPPLVFLPFTKGQSWNLTQAPGGTYSHTGKFYYAYDWNQGSGLKSTSNPAYGKYIYSPVKGVVVRVDKYVQDFVYNDKDYGTLNNNGRGNQIIIQDGTNSRYVAIYHMQQNSAAVTVGQAVEIGTYLGKVGMTGFSSSPHVHIQVESTPQGYSQPFNFVEAPVKIGVFATSLNLGKASVLDNDGALNLGNEFGTAQVSVGGSWLSYTSGQGFNGASYMVHTVGASDTAKFSWTFTVKNTAYYNVMVNLPGLNPGRDPQAKYNVFGSTVLVDQRQNDGIGEDNWVTLKYGYKLYAGTTYTITLQGSTPGTSIGADALILQRL